MTRPARTQDPTTGEIRDEYETIIGQVCWYDTREEAEDLQEKNSRLSAECTDGQVQVSPVYAFNGRYGFDMVWGN
jgi:hypothetical protein